MSEILFIIFGLLTLACAMGVVISKHPIHSAFSLVFSFFGLSALYILWGAHFAAMLQLLIYTGAIVVLFVFVLILIHNLRSSSVLTQGWVTLAITGATVWIFSLFLLRTMNHASVFEEMTKPRNDMRTVSLLLFTDYLWPFEVLSVFLLVLIVAAYALSRPEKEGP